MSDLIGSIKMEKGVSPAKYLGIAKHLLTILSLSEAQLLYVYVKHFRDRNFQQILYKFSKQVSVYKLLFVK